MDTWKILVSIITGDSNLPFRSDPTAVMQGWEDLYGIFKAFIDGIKNIVTSFFMILYTPLKGLADTFLVWFQGLQSALSRTWAGVPIWVGIVLILIVGGIIWAIIRDMRSTVEGWIPSPPKW